MALGGPSDHWNRLLLLRSQWGHVYGSEDLCVLLYSLVRRLRPNVVVELGSGIGISSLWMAHALRENECGHLYSIDDGSHGTQTADVMSDIAGHQLFGGTQAAPPHAFLHTLARSLQLESQITFIDHRIDLSPWPDVSWPVPDVDIDMVFADFDHSPRVMGQLFASFLPRMSDYSSFLFDSASTTYRGVEFLESLVHHLNAGEIPRFMTAGVRPDHRHQAETRIRTLHFELTHLTEHKARRQNSTAWLQIRPSDAPPAPTELMHD